jgi:hypothetical protein
MGLVLVVLGLLALIQEGPFSLVHGATAVGKEAMVSTTHYLATKGLLLLLLLSSSSFFFFFFFSHLFSFLISFF